MPSNDAQGSHAEDQDAPSSLSRVRSLFSIPTPLKRLFETVPVLTYSPNELPQRAPHPSKLPNLYVFGKGAAAAAGRPSFNPSCLKWQTFLKIAGIDHQLVSSNNHASPTGVLPFLLPAAQSSHAGDHAALPIPSNRLVKYARERGSEVAEPTGVRYEAYQSLLDHRIRNAWLYTLYLEPYNFNAVAYPLYVTPSSSNPIVCSIIAHQLRQAAEVELLKQSVKIDADDLYSEVDKAFESLSVLLGEDEWFFDDTPTLFDASVFAYTHLLLDERMGWKEKAMVRALRKRENLVQHRERLLNQLSNIERLMAA
ncbi:MAG: hypothetical protein M1818_004067 [Claussenomyces sp. TS43310]|nr:MAG: hypothetical protein M1818_004067 [Claussenomyces sp. TS43310]